MTEVLKTLRRLFSVAIEQGLIEREPVKLDIPARIHKSPIAYDDADQQALLAAAQALGPEYVAMVLLGIDGGLRRGEILGLQWSDLNLARASMTIHCWKQYYADFPNPLSALAFRHKSASYFTNSSVISRARRKRVSVSSSRRGRRGRRRGDEREGGVGVARWSRHLSRSRRPRPPAWSMTASGGRRRCRRVSHGRGRRCAGAGGDARACGGR
jgi:hypothetical protein